MSTTITSFETFDIRFATSMKLDGSDAMNPDPDYSAAYVVLRTDGDLKGTGWPSPSVAATISSHRRFAPRPSASSVFRSRTSPPTWAASGAGSRATASLRWLEPDKGVMHMAIGAVVNAVWDLWAKREGKPVWRLIADMTPDQVLDLIDFRYLSNALTRDEARAILERRRRRQGRADRDLTEKGYPTYTTRPAGSATTTRRCAVSAARGWPRAGPTSS